MNNYIPARKRLLQNFSDELNVLPLDGSLQKGGFPSRQPPEKHPFAAKVKYLTVPLDRDLRLIADAHNFTIQRQISPNGSKKPRWTNVGYFNTLSSALESACDEIVRRKGECTTVELLRVVHDLTHDIRRISKQCELAFAKNQEYLEARLLNEGFASSVGPAKSAQEHNHHQSIKEDENEEK